MAQVIFTREEIAAMSFGWGGGGGVMSASQIRDTLLADADSAELLNGGAVIATNNPTANLPTDGTTNCATNWATLIAQHRSVVFPHGDFTFATPMDIPDRRIVLGSGNFPSTAGFGTKIIGTSGQAAAVQIIGDASGPHVTVGRFSIGGSANAAFYAFETTRSRIFDIATYGAGTFVRGFDFDESVFNCTIQDLEVHDVTITECHYRCGAFFNANVCGNWSTHSSEDATNFLVEGGQGSTFSGLVAQSGLIGLHLKACTGHTFNSFYTEDVALPIKIGPTFVQGATFNSPTLGQPSSGHSHFADRIACIDLEGCVGVVFNGPVFTGLFGARTVTVTFTGASSGSGAEGYAMVHPDGTINHVVMLDGGSSYDDPVAVGFTGGSGSGATATATTSGGVITAVTMTAGGSGYLNGSRMPASIRLAGESGIRASAHISAPITRPGSNQIDVFHPTIVRQTGAYSGSRVSVDTFHTLIQSIGAHARLIGGTGTSWEHWLEELDSSGTPIRTKFIPPIMD